MADRISAHTSRARTPKHLRSTRGDAVLPKNKETSVSTALDVTLLIVALVSAMAAAAAWTLLLELRRRHATLSDEYDAADEAAARHLARAQYAETRIQLAERQAADHEVALHLVLADHDGAREEVAS